MKSNTRPRSNKCTCAAKLFVGLFASLFFCMGAVVCALGALSFSEAGDFLADAVPTSGPWILIAVGVTLLFVGISGVMATCSSKRRKVSLYLMTFLILLSFMLAVCAAFFTFAYTSVVAAGVKNGFASEGGGYVDSSVYGGLKSAFTTAYTSCNGVGYNTTAVKAECSEYAGDASQVTTCGGGGYPSGYAGLFCKSGPGYSSAADFTIDEAVTFPDPSSDTSLLSLQSYGALVNYACGPTQAAYESYLATVNAVLDNPASGLAESSGSLFEACYGSTWWTETEASVTLGAPMADVPNTDQPLNADQQAFFTDLEGATNALSPKMIFCMCAADGEDSKLFDLLHAAGEYAQYTALGVAVFLFFALVSALYLLCCKRGFVDDFVQNGEARKGQLGSNNVQLMMRP